MPSSTYSYGKKNDDVKTKRDFKEQIYKKYKINFDPCPYQCKKFDGLKIKWKSRNFVNPPYSNIRKWIEKALHERKKRNCRSVFLLPVRTGNLYWHELIFPHAKNIRFLRKGVYYEGYDKPAPFDSALVIF